MNYLLDTCVLSEFEKPQPEQKVIDWVSEQIEQTLYLSVVAIGEIQKGIAAMPKGKRKKDLEKWLQKLIYRFDQRIIPLGTDEMLFWGDLVSRFQQKGKVFPYLDSLIAATVLMHNLTLVTRNESDFNNTGVQILNIWK